MTGVAMSAADNRMKCICRYSLGRRGGGKVMYASAGSDWQL